MKINWDIKNPVQKRGIWRTMKAIKHFIFNTNVPLHNSNHYNRDHFL